ncbi:MAG: methyltransferase domain-containing protein [Burkholderiaceae bacterium]|nr:MAG: methyltransferase domain-containing protein [Burkholderiaceae bacterium]TAM06522.1 MAG: methyltransferase domain-containing protein [Pusillimonas sp.]
MQGAHVSEASGPPLIVELAEWLGTPAGQYVKHWEQEKINAMVANVFGYHAMQVGLPNWDLLQANRIPYKGRTHSYCDAGCPQPDVALYTDPENLPFDGQSIDLLILPHVLECSNSPHQVLREAERVLMPEGRVVVSGFNPWSLWGLHERAPGLDPITPIPAHMQVSLARLKDWFKLLSFEVDRGHFGCYAPPCETERWLQRWSFMEAAGDRWWPICGSAYVVSAIKRVACVRLVGPNWKRMKRPVRGHTVVTGRHSGA